MNIKLITVGKLKEKYLKDAVEEYLKRISKFCEFEIIEVPDEKIPDNASVKEEIQIKQKEGDLILKHIKDDMYVIALAIDGNMLSSPDFRNFIKKLKLTGKNNIAFIIGGSLGLSEKVLNRSNYKLSFSRMTFPHQLMRVILLEQICSLSAFYKE
ncbi:23S rRNA (pseudouridine1915-N3)-methyltransferase [Clostridium sp. USBA 49]|uniref:23S rRNA (pseudouridine(1915)-N(3))-methyltransferase RlmH n=1 Tax=Clostridium TaxID=1485 RepID=UPI00099921C2|nr:MULTISPECIES: 23S rRNA (pseudouridine(1915)-N(3))-methyltransferase RlmH [Clostridium]SKA88953.1 23S rRNA (pseudouridine1915-N3)-methyltransferase [Clostridium sp. USBA 49]